MIKKNTKPQQRKQINSKLPDQEILVLIGNPNPWTPAVEKQWLAELDGLSAGEIYSRFPPLRKPPSVGRRGRTRGWG